MKKYTITVIDNENGTGGRTMGQHKHNPTAIAAKEGMEVVPGSVKVTLKSEVKTDDEGLSAVLGLPA